MAETSEVIRRDIERTRLEMGETLDALEYKANVAGPRKGMDGTQEGRGHRWLRSRVLQRLACNRLDDLARLRSGARHRRACATARPA